MSCLPAGRFARELAVIDEVSLTRTPAAIGTRPVAWSPNEGAPRDLPLGWRDCWERAHQAMAAARYRRSDRLVIHDADPLDPVAEAMTDPAVALARYRLAARQPEPAPPTMHVRRGLVRLDGVELDERQSARVLDLVGYDDVADM